MEITIILVLCIVIYVIKSASDFRRKNGYGRIFKKEYNLKKEKEKN